VVVINVGMRVLPRELAYPSGRKVIKVRTNKLIKSILSTVTIGILYILVISIIVYIRYSEFIINDNLLMPYYLIFAVVGMIPILFHWYLFGTIFLSGTMLGLISECITTYFQGPHPTMAGAFYNVFIIILSFIIAVLAQFIYSISKVKYDIKVVANKVKE
jgi:hypothetical protein